MSSALLYCLEEVQRRAESEMNGAHGFSLEAVVCTKSKERSGAEELHHVQLCDTNDQEIKLRLMWGKRSGPTVGLWEARSLHSPAAVAGGEQGTSVPTELTVRFRRSWRGAGSQELPVRLDLLMGSTG